MFELGSLRVPIVQAPMAGGPSTPRARRRRLRRRRAGLPRRRLPDRRQSARRRRPRRESSPRSRSGSTCSCWPSRAVDDERLAAYADRLAVEARRRGVAAGEPHFDDDDFAAKLRRSPSCGSRSCRSPLAAPPPTRCGVLHERGVAVWVTVTEPDEGEQATPGRRRRADRSGRRGRRPPRLVRRHRRPRGAVAAAAAAAAGIA